VWGVNGVSFSSKKRAYVVDFKLPITQRDLKKFIGIATHFSSHIRNYSMISKPLHELLRNYKPRASLVWSEEPRIAFQRVKDAINNCPTLYFINESMPVILLTDASDYAIGAYLYQYDGTREYPIAFVSKSLTPQERRWATPDKEAFAIFFSFMKLEYLLRDIHFTLKTDHANLTFINLDFKGRVKRWKLAIQEFDFDVYHIAGIDNEVADAFSRMVPIDNPSSEDVLVVEELMELDNVDIPPDKYKLISQVHNSVLGHFGVDRTYMKLIGKGFKWQYMRQQIKKFIMKCPCCQKMSFLKVPIHANKFTTSSLSVWERVSVDTIGPFPEDDNGNIYIIVCIDNFSRFVMLYAAKDATAKSAAEALVHFTGIFGVPGQILSDNGKQFVNDIITELMYLFDTEHLLITPYSHEENSLVERCNREINRHLRALCFHKSVFTRWSRSLPLVQRIFNADAKESLGVSPAQIIFGNSVNLDRGLFLPHITKVNSDITLSQWTSEMLQAQHDIIKAAIELQVLKNHHHLQSDQSVQTEFPISSYVLVEYPDRPPSKLHSNYRGPLRVVNHNGSIYTLQNLITEKNEDHHISKLQPFYYDPTETDPVLIANKDQQLAIVESILEMNGNPHGSRKDLMFKVHWKGRTEKDDSWEPYTNLRHNSILHEYLIQQKLKKLIPK